MPTTKTAIRNRLHDAIANIQLVYADDADPAFVIAAIATAATELEAATRFAIHHARDRGVAWETIATSLGVTRQSAWERYAPKDER